MKAKFAPILLAATLAVGLQARPAPAMEIAEVRGDFYYDSEGQFMGMRHVEMPQGVERRPMSAREKFELLGVRLPERPTYLEPRPTFPKPAQVVAHEKLSLDIVIVKFVEGMRVRQNAGRLRANGAPMPEVDAILARYPDAALHRVFDTSERILDENKESGERISGKELADLNNFYLFKFDAPSQRGVDLANELLALDIVEIAYLQAMGEAPLCGDIAPATPSWVGSQNYLNAAPDGVDAYYSWAYHAGGNGAGPGFWVADCEWDWCVTHEDLNIGAGDVLNGLSGGADPDHGTAVLGEIGSCNNAYGVTGISHDVQLKMSDFDSAISWAANIGNADAWLIPGEVMLMEIHIWGGPSGEACVCNCPQFEYVPVEWDVASFNAIQTATANGQIVVEAAGNGSMNLDHARYGGWFNPGHDSGAIMVGAGTNNGHAPECWTDYGSRVNVHGYGDTVYSSGYGNLFNQAGCNQDYTWSFSGTSSASPIIVGVCANVQGIANQKYGIDLSAGQIRLAIQQGGTPQAAPLSKNIGPMPNLVNAINYIEPDVIAAYTPAGWSYPMVPRVTADSNGGSAPLPAGALPGNVSGTYLNWTEQNPAYSWVSTINSPQDALFLEDNVWWWCFNPNMAPGAWSWCGNVGPNFVKGGRHTILSRADWQGVEDEWAEGNNDWARQYIWSGLPLALNAPVTRSYDPTKTSTGSGPYFNAEGFQGTTNAQYWFAFAIMPESAGSDFDVYLNAEAPANIPQQGFGAAVATSGAGGHVSDFVIIDRNTAPGGTYYASGINWSGTANKVVEFDDDNGVLANLGVNGPYTLGSGNLVEIHEVALSIGVPTRIQIQWISGDADFGVSVHRDPSGFNSKYSSLAGGYAENFGPHNDEVANVTTSAGTWHGVAVWKKDSASLYESLTYNVIVSPLPNLTDTTPPGWTGPIVPRNTTDATTFNAVLPATLAGNASTTSYNFSTYNQGPGAVAFPWTTYLYVDDVAQWSGGSPASTPPLDWARWQNTLQGFPQSTVKGGRHHLRTDSDVFNDVAELPESDNTFVDWFSWSPLALVDGVNVLRTGPPLKDPVGVGPEWSCDGFSTNFASYWSAVGVLPSVITADYDVRLHNAYVGSKDGFNSILDWSGDATDGNVDFELVNYNVVGSIPDFSVLNWNASGSNFVVERAEATTIVTANPGLTTIGPITEGPNGVLNAFEFYLPAASVGLPVYISMASDAGTANMGIKLFNGTVPYHNVFSYQAESNSGGAGVDEHMPAQFYGSQGYHGIVVHKTNTNDLPLTATYRVVISVGGSATDVPVVEMPTSFALSAPRPNPFGSETTIRFDVPAGGGRASVAVYDLQGRRIASLAEGDQSAGRHLLTWKGTDAAGEKVAVGVYFVRLETATVQETKKITLLR